MAKARICPNCGRPITRPSEGCVLHALIDALSSRDTVGKRRLLDLHASCDVDALWDDLGPIVDTLEAGGYN